MTLAATRAALVATLESVPGIGLVHDHQPFAKMESDFRAFYQSAPGGPILGWHVTRNGVAETVTDRDDPDARMESQRWRVVGYMSLSETGDSEVVFDNLVEAVRAAFRADDTLGGAVWSCITEQAAGLQVDQCIPVMFAGVLCHMANCSLTTVSYLP